MDSDEHRCSLHSLAGRSPKGQSFFFTNSVERPPVASSGPSLGLNPKAARVPWDLERQLGRVELCRMRRCSPKSVPQMAALRRRGRSWFGF